VKFTELYEEHLDISADETWELIERDCQPFLREWNGKILWRGIKDTREKVLKLPVRQDRKPRDTATVIHKALNFAFKKNGFTANRENSIFCSGSLSGLSTYGDAYAVFPIGEYAISWSPDVNDWTEDFAASEWITAEGLDLIRKIGWGKVDKLSSHHIKLYGSSGLVKYIQHNYKNTDINAAIASRNEIMIHCDKYYAIRKPTSYDYSWSVTELVNKNFRKAS